MKRGTPDHPKTLDLAALLGLERWGAVGVLESLFHFAATYAKRGDIGRHTDAAIARGIGWSGDPETLIEGLVRAGWLDCCRCHRLRIHDWHDHADQTVTRSAEVKSLGFIACYKDASATLAPDERDTSQPLPLPLPLPKPKPEPLPVSAQPRGETLPAVVVWSREACDAWIERFGGTAPGGQIGKALKPLVDRHGWEVVRQAWCSYLRQVEADYASPARFASTFGRWNGSAPPGQTKAAAVLDNNRAVLERFVKGGQ